MRAVIVMRSTGKRIMDFGCTERIDRLLPGSSTDED
jgi:hypothetical protein